MPAFMCVVDCWYLTMTGSSFMVRKRVFETLMVYLASMEIFSSLPLSALVKG